jgi:biotin synthase
MHAIRHNWTFEEILAIYDLPLMELIFRAATVHRQYFDPTKVQVNHLVSIKTGGCPEDCSYCPQAARYNTGTKRHALLPLEEVMELAEHAKKQGASRMCLGAAWREVKDNQQFDGVIAMVKGITDLGMEVCCTLGMLNESQAQRLKDAGLYSYNHNVDTGKAFYKSIISTRTYEDRLRTLENVRKADLSVCSGGIIGMGESKEDRIEMLLTLSGMSPHPDSVPINTLVPVAGTPLGDRPQTCVWEWLRMVATTRIVLPGSVVRLSAGRKERSDAEQALLFFAGANSIFSGDKLLTTPNPDFASDHALFARLGLHPTVPYELAHASPAHAHC